MVFLATLRPTLGGSKWNDSSISHGINNDFYFIRFILCYRLVTYAFQYRFRIPGWLFELYRTARPMATFDIRRPPQIPELPFEPGSCGGPRSFREETPPPVLEYNFKLEPCIMSKVLWLKFTNDWKTDYESTRNRFIKRYR